MESLQYDLIKITYIPDMDEEGGLQYGVDFNELQIDRDRKAVIKRHDIDRKVRAFLSFLIFIKAH
jgi:hypothetical protein